MASDDKPGKEQWLFEEEIEKTSDFPWEKGGSCYFPMNRPFPFGDQRDQSSFPSPWSVKMGGRYGHLPLVLEVKKSSIMPVEGDSATSSVFPPPPSTPPLIQKTSDTGKEQRRKHGNLLKCLGYIFH